MSGNTRLRIQLGCFLASAIALAGLWYIFAVAPNRCSTVYAGAGKMTCGFSADMYLSLTVLFFLVLTVALCVLAGSAYLWPGKEEDP